MNRSYTFTCPSCDKGKITVLAFTEVEGDVSEPGGRLIHRYTAAEWTGQTCDCPLSNAAIDILCQRAIDTYDRGE